MTHSSWKEDRIAEGTRPDRQIVIYHLDEKAIVRWWHEQRYYPNWRMFLHNCSTVVAEALKAGGAGQRCPGWDAAGLLRWHPVLLAFAARKL